MSEFDYSPTVACNYNMTRNEVVEVLQRELQLLRDELERRDKIVAELIESAEEEAGQAVEAGGMCDPGIIAPRCDMLLLKRIEDANLEIHDELRPVAADIRREGANARDQTDG